MPALGVLLLATAALAVPRPAYNEVRQKSSHNAYQRSESLLDQLVYHGIRSLELDLHNGRSSTPKAAGDWFVYHDESEPGTTCFRLSDCLDALRAFHLAHPRHEVVTVWLDLKDRFEDGHAPQDLDARLTRHLPRDWLFTPSDLVAACPRARNLTSSVTGDCGWPSLDALRGRFLIVLTGGDVSKRGNRLNTYVANGAEALARVGFVAPGLSRADDIGKRDYAVFFNLKRSRVHLAARVHRAGFVSRVWGVNNPLSWLLARLANANHLATDKVNARASPWAVLRNRQGWPFDCIDSSACAGFTENLDVIGAEVASGDLWSTRDSFLFASEQATSVGTNIWTAEVHTPDSHVDDWAKGCLMVRESPEADARYFAVCRPADDHPPRVQYRTLPGGSTASTEVDLVPANTVAPKSVAFVRLMVNYDGIRTCAAGYGSADGTAWTEIGGHCFPGLLGHQGLATSAHGRDPVKVLFSNVMRNGTRYRLASFPTRTAVGQGVSGARLFDGVAANR